MIASSFAYDGFPNSTAHRLMRLSPNQKSQHVVCEMTTTQLPDNGNCLLPYRALSYCWGSQWRGRKIMLRYVPDGVEGLVGVTENLYSFLLTMIAIGDFDWLFVDAVCINQDNLLERAQQVRIMSEIYRSASRVIVWLEENEDTQYLLQWARTEMILISPTYPEWNKENVLHALKTDEHLVSGFQRVAGDAYWTRLWIVPEFRLGQTIDIQCGKSALMWQGLWHFWREFQFALPEQAQMQGGLMQNILQQKGTVFSKELQTLVEYVRSFAAQRCTDPRDKIYALLPLASDVKDFPIDYGIPLEELFLTTWLRLDCAHKKDATFDLWRALDTDTQSLVRYASKPENGRDTLALYECAFLQPGQSPVCVCGLKLEFGPKLRNRKYAICCVIPGVQPATHILVKTDEKGDRASDQTWTTIGLLRSDGGRSDISDADFSAVDDTGSESPLKSVTAQPDINFPETFEDEMYEGVQLSRSKLHITKFGLATLIDYAVQSAMKHGTTSE